MVLSVACEESIYSCKILITFNACRIQLNVYLVSADFVECSMEFNRSVTMLAIAVVEDTNCESIDSVMLHFLTFWLIIDNFRNIAITAFKISRIVVVVSRETNLERYSSEIAYVSYYLPVARNCIFNHAELIESITMGFVGM